ncbi:hypothetical protein [Zooshikella ganghwensis]|uniref:Uncharacterized protein n=1 Tax=Zooshikella ganghwensis TaxID=202772 RepID=A0A4V1INA5_9GAMM|nr:hypothetical protein [Zooshikella ganghwensis]RDH43051.1 hypothetical protein B9G39_06065 [Zooshikella ganghwensis]
MKKLKINALCLMTATALFSSVTSADDYITSIEYLRDPIKYPPDLCELDIFTMTGTVMVEFLLTDVLLPQEVCERAKKVARKFEKDISRWSIDDMCAYAVIGTGNNRYTKGLTSGCNNSSRLKKDYQLERNGSKWECDASVVTSTPTDGRYPLHTTTETNFGCQIVDYGHIFSSEGL